jgi:hypothetical protein
MNLIKEGIAMRWIFDGSNVFAFVCLMLALICGAFGYALADGNSNWDITVYGFAVVLAVFGVSVYVHNFLNGDAAGGKRVTQ